MKKSLIGHIRKPCVYCEIHGTCKKHQRVPARSKYEDTQERRKRFRAIYDTLDVSPENLAAMLGVSKSHVERILYNKGGKAGCSVPLLAKMEVLKRRKVNLESMKRAKARRAVEKAPDVPVVADDAALRTEAFRLHMAGESNETIAQKLALSPDTVRFWISQLR